MNPLQIINAITIPVVVINADERIVAMNGAAQTLLGADSTGQHYITALRQPALLDAIETVLRDGTERTCRFLADDYRGDATYRVHVAASTGTQTRQAVLSFEDLTDVQAAGQMRRDFVANVSHEMRTPLTAISGFIETLRGPAKEDAAARDRFLALMEGEAARLGRLVDDLLSLARVEDSERRRPATSVDLTALCQQSVISLRDMAQKAGVTLHCDVPDTLVHVTADADQLGQVMLNLIENAIKYGGAGQGVTVTLHPPAAESRLRGMGVRIDVADQGSGIAPHHIARLTERFYRVDSHRARDVGGTGLGLAIVKHILNRHQGRLRISSTLGKGSVFTVILPL